MKTIENLHESFGDFLPGHWPAAIPSCAHPCSVCGSPSPPVSARHRPYVAFIDRCSTCKPLSYTMTTGNFRGKPGQGGVVEVVFADCLINVLPFCGAWLFDSVCWLLVSVAFSWSTPYYDMLSSQLISMWQGKHVVCWARSNYALVVWTTFPILHDWTRSWSQCSSLSSIYHADINADTSSCQNVMWLKHVKTMINDPLGKGLYHLFQCFEKCSLRFSIPDILEDSTSRMSSWPL